MDSAGKRMQRSCKSYVGSLSVYLGLLLAIICVRPEAVLSQTALGQAPLLARGELPEDVGLVDQVVSSSFVPRRVYMLQEVRPGEVLQYPGAHSIGSLSGFDAEKTLLVGAATFLSPIKASQSHFTFFLLNDDGSFAATAVRAWSKATIMENSRQTSDLVLSLAKYEAEFAVKREKLEQREEGTQELRDKAAQIARVDSILRLRREIQDIAVAEKEREVEISRLKKLITQGRKAPEPEDAREWRRVLSEQLKEAAQITAMADRLNRRKRDAALASIERKRALIREAKSYDAKELATQVLKLRKQRRALEAKFSPDASATNRDF